MSSAGRTVERIESPVQGEHGPDDSMVRIHFTDGTALEIGGSSYEEVSQSVEHLDGEAVRRRQRAAQGWREQKRLERLCDEEWLSVSCEERTRRREAKRAQQSAFGLLMDDQVSGAMQDMLLDSMRPNVTFGEPWPETRVRTRCKSCGDARCPNAGYRTLPAVPSISGKQISFEPIFRTATANLGPEEPAASANPPKTSPEPQQ